MSTKIIQGDCLKQLKLLENESIDCCITSPPYWNLRNYGVEGQIGLEKTPEEYVAKMVVVFCEVRRVLKKHGTLWLNLGDCYNSPTPGSRDSIRWPKQSRNNHKCKKIVLRSLKPKDLVGIPWRVAFALQNDGWYLRQDIIWHKPNPMPESVTDRCTKSHEYIFLMAKNESYYFDQDAIREKSISGDSVHVVKYSEGAKNIEASKQRGGQTRPTKTWVNTPDRNKRSVWTVVTKPFKDAHFATFPEKLIIPCVRAGCPAGGVILDPFSGAGTTGVVAKANNRNFIGIELNPKYIEMARRRIDNTMGTML